MTKRLITIISCLIISGVINAQDELEELLNSSTEEKKSEYTIATFKTTRIINAHSIETVKKKSLDFRITHRFGDIGGVGGGVHTLYGFDNVTDVRIAFEYGITDFLTVGLGRNKGAAIIRELLDGYVKYRLLKQTVDNNMPLSVTLLGSTAFTYMRRSVDSTSEAYLPQFAHRFSYVTQAIIGKKFHNRVSLQIMPTYIHRNYVSFGDENNNFAFGIGGRVKLTQSFGIIADYFYIFSQFRQDNSDIYYNPLSVGFEIETGGHVFHVNFTNSQGIIENQFLPYTNSSWTKGGFRFGFTISRVFVL